MRVLVAVPYRLSTPSVFLDSARRHFDALTFGNCHLMLWGNCLRDESRRYGTNAAARNMMIETFLSDSYTHVLWMDVDLVNTPNDLIEQLAAISERDIIAPFVFVERIRTGPSSHNNGGWFYDTGGFIHKGKRARAFAPHFDGYPGGTIEMDSVGCCYLAPMEIYRLGCRYEPVGDEVEHVSLMAQARAMGVRVWATDTVQVTHAYLPRYGEAWHG